MPESVFAPTSPTVYSPSMHFGVAYYPEALARGAVGDRCRAHAGHGNRSGAVCRVLLAEAGAVAGLLRFCMAGPGLAVLAGRGIKAILGTPTATPPAWIIQANPEILPVDSTGITRGFGGRHHDCQSNATYREHVRRIVTAMVEHYGRNPQVIGWQVDNELGQPATTISAIAHPARRRSRSWAGEKVRHDRLAEPPVGNRLLEPGVRQLRTGANAAAYA